MTDSPSQLQPSGKGRKHPRVPRKQVVGVYLSPKGRHRHKCGHCFAVWEHADSDKPTAAAHTCPKCGFKWVGDIDHYYGIEFPAYTDQANEKEAETNGRS